MTTLDREDAFRRSLLESARGDGPTADAKKEAWAKLAGSLGAAAGIAAVGHGAVASSSRAWLAKGLLIGAAIGATGSAAWFGMHRTDASVIVDRTPAEVVSSASAVRSIEVHADAIAPAPPTSSASPLTTAAITYASPTPSLPPALTKPATTMAAIASSIAPPVANDEPPVIEDESSSSTSPSTASTLAAEVAAIDSARLAVATKRFDDALGEIARYRARFPAGALAHDVDVVEIEAFAGKGDRQALASAASRFLAAYPNDPDTARVKMLAKN